MFEKDAKVLVALSPFLFAVQEEYDETPVRVAISFKTNDSSYYLNDDRCVFRLFYHRSLTLCLLILNV